MPDQPPPSLKFRKDEANSESLRPLLNLWDASAIVVGCIIGTGIFRAPSSISKYVPDSGQALLLWLIGGILSLAGGLCYAELAASYPKTGGDYIFLKEAYGSAVSFVFGWTKVFVERTGTIAIIGYIFAEYTMSTFQQQILKLIMFMTKVYFILKAIITHAPNYTAYTINIDSILQSTTRGLAVSAIILLTLANALGLSLGKTIQNLFTFLKLLALGIIIGCGLYFMKDHPPAASFAWQAPLTWNSLPALGMGLTFIIWTYSGWGDSAYVAEEVKNPEKNLPRSIVLGLMLVTVLYLSVNAVYHYYLRPDAMQANRFVASSMMSAAWGTNAGRAVSAMVMCSAFGALNGFILTTGRILFAMAKDHPIFSPFTRVHPIHRTPTWSLWINGAIAVFLVIIGTFDNLVTYTTVVITIFNAMAVGSVIVLRKKYPTILRPYKAWGYPWTPLVFMGICAVYVVSATCREPKVALTGMAIAACGLPLYRISSKLKT